MDRDSSGYIFFNSVYDTSSSISHSNYDASNSGPFILGSFQTTHNFLNGKLADMRFFRWGNDGLTITGTHSAGNLLIKVKTDTIYCQATNKGLVKDLYDNSYSTLGELGYDEMYDARGMECLSSKDFSDSTKWGKLVTYGFLSFKDSVVTVNFDAVTACNFYQTAANRADSLSPDHYYLFEYEVKSNTLTGTPIAVNIFNFGSGTDISIKSNLSVGVHSLV